MESTKELIELGKSFGLEGKNLLEFVETREQKNVEREERLRQREERAKEAERKADLDMIEKQLELQRLKNEGHIENNGHVTVAKGPKLPHFEESVDNMDAYLLRFERYALCQQWPEKDYTMHLSALLKGKALEVYSRMSAADAADYSKLKNCLLRSFQLTEEGFRRKFHSEKMAKGELPSQFVARLTNYFDRWISAANVMQEYQQLHDFLILEQFLFQCPNELSVYLRERSVRTIDAAMTEADVYMEAHHMTVENTRRKPEGRASQIERNPAKQPPEQQSYQKFQDRKPDKPRLVCFICDKVGHKAIDCRLKSKLTNFSAAVKTFDIPVAEAIDLNIRVTVDDRSTMHKSQSSTTTNVMLDGLPTQPGHIGNQRITAMRDTGCTGVIVKRSLVTERQMTGEDRPYVLVDNTVRSAPVAEIYVDTPYYTGTVEALCLDNPICELIIGNIVNSPSKPVPPPIVESESIRVDSSAACTRSQSKLKSTVNPLKVPHIPMVDHTDFLKEQESDTSLAEAHKMADTGKVSVRATTETVFFRENGYLYRQVTTAKEGRSYEPQLVVPRKFRNVVLRTAHESIFSGHMGVTKTTDKIQGHFYWPGMHGDVGRFCQSCDICQKTIPRGKVKRVPLENMPIVTTPFDKVSVDIIGPLSPKSKRGHRYILTLVDMATRYPMAVPLVNIDSVSVAEALVSMISNVGVPREVLSDRGAQFTSEVMDEVKRLLSIQSVFTTPYHAQCNGLCEKYNGTLKLMLKRMTSEAPNDWDRMIEPLLFAYRESQLPNLGGFSPFELLYGRTVRGPMAILKEMWSKTPADDEIKINC